MLMVLHHISVAHIFNDSNLKKVPLDFCLREVLQPSLVQCVCIDVADTGWIIFCVEMFYFKKSTFFPMKTN